MNPIFILLLMMFAHVFDDYVLQGCLANLKQKKWWQTNAPDEKYKKDYIAGLICHAFSWTFMIMLPIAYNTSWFITCPGLLVLYPINWAVHAITDDLKANKFKINLIQDQLIHFTQIVLSFLIYLIIMS